jgi:predicted nucleotidyltransferase
MDIESLLKLLNDRAVDYVIIGAQALPVHGYTRITLDLDVFIRPTEANAAKVLDALRVFGYDVTDVTVQDLLNTKLLIRQYVIETDIHPSVLGVSFEDVWQHRVAAKHGGTPAFFASLEDLIRMKEAANRPKDQEDLRVLREIQRRRAR